MIATRRFVAGILVLASIVGVVMLQRSRPVQSGAAEFSHLGDADDAVRAQGRVRHIGLVLRGCTDRQPAIGWHRRCRQSLRGDSDGPDHDVHGRPRGRRSCNVVRRARSRNPDVRSGSMQPAGHLRLIDGRDLRGRRLRRATRRRAASGSAVSPCSNSTSSSWYFADGYTVEGSREDLVITNPFPSDVPIVNIRRGHRTEGSRAPATCRACPSGHSVLVVSSGPARQRDDSVLAVTVTSTRGRVVVGRAQQYLASVRPRRLHDDARRAVARRTVLLCRRRGRPNIDRALQHLQRLGHRGHRQRRVPRPRPGVGFRQPGASSRCPPATSSR